MVDEETRRYRPTKNYLAPVLPPLNITAFETPLMKTELDRVASRMPMDTLSMKRYELPPPPAGKMTGKFFRAQSDLLALAFRSSALTLNP